MGGGGGGGGGGVAWSRNLLVYSQGPCTTIITACDIAHTQRCIGYTCPIIINLTDTSRAIKNTLK